MSLIPKISYKDVLTCSYPFYRIKQCRDVYLEILKFMDVDSKGLWELLWYWEYDSGNEASCIVCGRREDWFLGEPLVTLYSAYIGLNGRTSFKTVCSKRCLEWGDKNAEVEPMV